MGNQATIMVEKGPFSGKIFVVPETGLRIGRSSRNDMVLKDPAMSRFHCRVYPAPGGGLFVADLGSSNDTCVNDRPVQEARLEINDRIAIGQTVLKIIDDGTAHPIIDLGLSRGTNADAGISRPQSSFSPRWITLLGFSGLLIIIVLTALIWRDWPRREPLPVPAPEPQPPSLEVYYEKVEAGAKNIFRYNMILDNNRLALEIDDLENQRRVRKTATVDDTLVRELASAIENSGFFELLPDYSGLAPDIHDRSEIRVTIGNHTHQCVVFNRIAPDIFKKVSERLEILAQNELGTAALALPPEELLKLAREAYLLGQSLYDERALRHVNLYRSIRALREVEWYLESIEPKPDYYADAVALRRQTERALDERLQNLNFLAERAIQGRDWREAAIHLRTILETIPDRSDSRHRHTVERLLDVERRIERGI